MAGIFRFRINSLRVAQIDVNFMISDIETMTSFFIDILIDEES